jgi:hypothetical protein
MREIFLLLVKYLQLQDTDIVTYFSNVPNTSSMSARF